MSNSLALVRALAPAPAPRLPPQRETHAHYTHSRFWLRSPPHDHPQFLHPGPSSCSASPSAPPRTGYPYASHSIDALASYPGPVDAYRPHQYKTQPPSSAWPSTAPATAPTSAMAITVPHYARPAPASSSSGMSSRDGADDSASGSDGGRDPTPPPAARQRGKEVKKKVHACMMCHKSFDRCVDALFLRAPRQTGSWTLPFAVLTFTHSGPARSRR